MEKNRSHGNIPHRVLAINSCVPKLPKTKIRQYFFVDLNVTTQGFSLGTLFPLSHQNQFIPVYTLLLTAPSQIKA